MLYIRWILTLIIMYGIYTETGIFTTIFCGLVALASEIENYNHRKLERHENAL